ncbi:hypothetical protein BGW36DRAFT_296088 [Talaromyces proteolyticus]|uniref:Uncharacterized protein n=1 Tax=Talaromyces proteolyticus TaxID=1131652 RepID=A0AAD4KS97_9EURO|nr:uncharacterized protein BGW36DRAFT_296088 [Talaromyces proteolyticus]KAH8697257.1 hypothetical protein BGW36DRAFT_296088 [Talaromyces proteolyticus]
MSSPSPENIFKSLHEIFYTRKSNDVLEIEILLPGQGPLLRDGCFIGITKSALVKAFIVARKNFLHHVTRLNGSSSLSLEAEGEFAAIPAVILLFDCEHTTACNWRKRLVKASIDKYIAEGDIDRDGLLDILERELNLITTFVCSPLHRHTKSPTLWQHRLWVMTERLKLQGSALHEAIFLSLEAIRNFILAEFAIVCKAAELHPKNYYAFSYIRQLHSTVSNLSTRMAAEDVTDVSPLLCDLAITLVEPALKWCLSNPKDISGWMFLLYLLSHEATSDNEEQNMIQLRKMTMERAMHFAIKVTAWKGESLWTFVDLMMTKFGPTVLPATIKLDSDQMRLYQVEDLPVNIDTTRTKLKSESKVWAATARWRTTMHLIIKSHNDEA